MGEDQINKWLASIPIYGQFYLAKKLRETKLENHELEIRRTQLARENSEIEKSRASLEAALQKAQPKLDAAVQLKKSIATCRRDLEVSQQECNSLSERIQATDSLTRTNEIALDAERDKKERWKKWAQTLKEVVKQSEIKADDAMRIVMPHLIDVLGVRILLFNEQEQINFITTAAAERLGSSKKDIINKTFSEIFDCPSIGWLLDVGPRYPLLIRDTQEEVGASVAEIPYGVGTTYAVALREKAAKAGLVQRLVPQRLAAPLTVCEDYRTEVAMALARSTGKSRFLGNDVYIDLKHTQNVEPALGTWLAKIISERNESARQGTVILCMPSQKVYKQLRRYNIPIENIKLPRKEELRCFEYNPPSPKILLAGGNV